MKTYEPFQSASWEHMCGTDMLGMDVCHQLLEGTCVALMRGASSATLAVVLGVCASFCVFMLPLGWQRHVRGVLVKTGVSFPVMLVWVLWCVVCPVESHVEVVVRVACVVAVRVMVLCSGVCVQTMDSEPVRASYALGGTVLHVMRWHLWRACQPFLIVWWNMAFMMHTGADHALQWIGVIPYEACTPWGRVLKSASYAPYVWVVPVCALLWTTLVLYGMYWAVGFFNRKIFSFGHQSI